MSVSLLCSRGNKCSYYEAISRVSGHKVTIKEHHFNNFEGQEPAEEAKILSKMSHACIPRLREVFLTDASLFMVRCPLSFSLCPCPANSIPSSFSFRLRRSLISSIPSV